MLGLSSEGAFAPRTHARRRFGIFSSQHLSCDQGYVVGRASFLLGSSIYVNFMIVFGCTLDAAWFGLRLYRSGLHGAFDHASLSRYWLLSVSCLFYLQPPGRALGLVCSRQPTYRRSFYSGRGPSGFGLLPWAPWTPSSVLLGAHGISICPKLLLFRQSFTVGQCACRGSCFRIGTSWWEASSVQQKP
jgi:hypothetical protein